MDPQDQKTLEDMMEQDAGTLCCIVNPPLLSTFGFKVSWWNAGRLNCRHLIYILITSMQLAELWSQNCLR